MTLPNRGLRLTMPLYFGHSVVIGPSREHGLIPDIAIPDIPACKPDAVMAKVQELIGK